MTATDIIDGGITTLKVAPAAVLGVTAALILPAQVLSALVLRDRLLGSGAAGALRTLLRLLFTDSLDTTLPEAADYWLLVLQSIELVLVTSAITLLVMSWYERRAVLARDVLVAALRRSPALIAAWFFVHLLELASGLGLVAPAVLVMALLMPVTCVITAEGLGPISALRRSSQLARTRFSAVLGVGLLIGLVDLVVAFALTGVGVVVRPFSWSWIVDQALGGVASLVTTAFVAAATTLLYIDLRVRAEGLDLELGMNEHFRDR